MGGGGLKIGMKRNRSFFSLGITQFLLILAITVPAGCLGEVKVDLLLPDLPTKEKQIELDGRTYRKSQLVNYFLASAFSSVLWNDDTGTDKDEFMELFLDRLSKPVPDPRQFAHSHYPWLDKYIFRKEFPSTGVLHKWNQPRLAIGIGWPPYNLAGIKAYTSEFHEFSNNEKLNDEADAKLRSILNELIPQISKASGIEIQLRTKTDAEELTPQFAQIRIIPTTRAFDSWFKMTRFISPVVGGWDSPSKREYRLWGAVPFTPYKRSQVYGYLLPRGDNQLDMAVCKVEPSLGRELLRALLAECLVRVLGLPETIEENEGSLLGNWNKAYDPISKLPALDGVKESGIEHQEDFLDKKPPGTLNGFAFSGLTEFDSQMLKLMYCPSIRSGMDKYQAVAAFAQSDCWD